MELPKQPGAGPESTGTEEEHEALRQEGPRIYVASLSDYNAGILHGEWIEADQPPEDLHEATQAMLQRSPSPEAEEFAIHDYEGFGHYEVEEYDSLEWISRVACGITDQGLAFSAWAEQCDQEPDVLDRFEDAYRGDWMSVQDYAEELVGDLGYERMLEEALPEPLAAYVHFDVEGFARDLELGGDISAIAHSGGVWIFEGQF